MDIWKYVFVQMCLKKTKNKLNEARVYSSFLVNEDTSLVSHILVRFKIIIIKKGQSNRILSTFQSLFKFYFSYSIKFPTVPQHKMQHAEKGKKKVLKLKSSHIPTQTKKNPSPSEKSSTYKLKRGLNYTENREPELHLTNTYIQKEKKKKHQIFPFKLSTVCGSLRQDQICNFYWNRSISLTRVKYKKLHVVQFSWITSHNMCTFTKVWQHPYCIPLNS